MPSFSNMVSKAHDSANRKLQCAKQQYLACVVGGIRERLIYLESAKGEFNSTQANQCRYDEVNFV